VPKAIRRREFALPAAEIEKILVREEYGVLASVGFDGQPYGTPLHYVYEPGAIYFHCSREGHLAANIAHNPRVCFTVIGRTKILPEKVSADYESVIAFGAVRFVAEKQKISVLRKLVQKYAADFTAKGEEIIGAEHEKTAVYKIEVEDVQGKRRWQSGG